MKLFCLLPPVMLRLFLMVLSLMLRALRIGLILLFTSVIRSSTLLILSIIRQVLCLFMVFLNFNNVVMNKSYDFAYNKGINREIPLSNISSIYYEALKDKCLNNNDIVKIIYQLSDELGLQPNPIDMSFNPNLPTEVKSVLDMLNREFPAVKGFATDKEAFETIKSRYFQSAGELDDFVHSLADEFLTSKVNDGSVVSPDPSVLDIR